MPIFLRRCLVSLLLLVSCCTAGAAEVLVVFDDKLSGFVDTADALKQELVRNGMSASDIVRVSSVSASDGFDWGRWQPRMVVTLGADALRQVLEQNFRVPLLATLIPRWTFEHTLRQNARKWQGGVSAVYMDQPLGRQLDFIRLLMPRARRVGVMWGAESSAQESALVVAASSRQLEVVSADARLDVPVAQSLQQALEGAEVLLAIPDARVFNSSTISNILMASYRARVPVVAFSPAYVKAGAMAALYTTPVQIGTQTGVLARSLLQVPTSAITQYPVDYVVGINDRVASSLGYSLDPAYLLDKLKRMEHKP